MASKDTKGSIPARPLGKEDLEVARPSQKERMPKSPLERKGLGVTGPSQEELVSKGPLEMEDVCVAAPLWKETMPKRPLQKEDLEFVDLSWKETVPERSWEKKELGVKGSLQRETTLQGPLKTLDYEIVAPSWKKTVSERPLEKEDLGIAGPLLKETTPKSSSEKKNRGVARPSGKETIPKRPLEKEDVGIADLSQKPTTPKNAAEKKDLGIADPSWTKTVPERPLEKEEMGTTDPSHRETTQESPLEKDVRIASPSWADAVPKRPLEKKDLGDTGPSFKETTPEIPVQKEDLEVVRPSWKEITPKRPLEKEDLEIACPLWKEIVPKRPLEREDLGIAGPSWTKTVSERPMQKKETRIADPSQRETTQESPLKKKDLRIIGPSWKETIPKRPLEKDDLVVAGPSSKETTTERPLQKEEIGIPDPSWRETTQESPLKKKDLGIAGPSWKGTVLETENKQVAGPSRRESIPDTPLDEENLGTAESLQKEIAERPLGKKDLGFARLSWQESMPEKPFEKEELGVASHSCQKSKPEIPLEVEDLLGAAGPSWKESIPELPLGGEDFRDAGPSHRDPGAVDSKLMDQDHLGCPKVPAPGPPKPQPDHVVREIAISTSKILPRPNRPPLITPVNHTRSLGMLAIHSFAKLLIDRTLPALKTYWQDDYQYDDATEFDENDPYLLEEQPCLIEHDYEKRMLLRRLLLVRKWFNGKYLVLKRNGYMDLISNAVIDILDCLPASECEPFHRLTIQLLFCQKVGYLGQDSSLEVYGVDSCIHYAKFLKLFIPFRMTTFMSTEITFGHPAPMAVILKYSSYLDYLYGCVDLNELFMRCIRRFSIDLKEIYFESRISDGCRVCDTTLFETFFGNLDKSEVMERFDVINRVPRTFGRLRKLKFDFPSVKYQSFLYCFQYYCSHVKLEFVKCIHLPMVTSSLLKAHLEPPPFLLGKGLCHLSTVEFEVHTDIYEVQNIEINPDNPFPTIGKIHFMYFVKKFSANHQVQFKEILSRCECKRVSLRMPNFTHAPWQHSGLLQLIGETGKSLKELHIETCIKLNLRELVALLNICQSLEILSFDVKNIMPFTDINQFSLSSLNDLKYLSIGITEWKMYYDFVPTDYALAVINSLISRTPNLKVLELDGINAIAFNSLVESGGLNELHTLCMSPSSSLAYVKFSFAKIQSLSVLRLYDVPRDDFIVFKTSFRFANVDIIYCDMRQIGLREPYCERK